MENIEKRGMTCIDCVHYLACSAKGGLFNEKDDSKEMLCRFFFNKRDCAKVVRCEDCKHFKYKCDEFLEGDVVGNCERSRTGFFDDGAEVYGNGYCSCGERK